MTIRPFIRAGHFTVFDNLVLDWLMPRVKPTSWKVICYIVRQTRGWHRDQFSASYAEIREGTGIKSDTTVAAALAELSDIGLIIQTTDDGLTARYCLNLDFAVEIDGDRVRKADGAPSAVNLTADIELVEPRSAASLTAVRRLFEAELDIADPAQVQAVLRRACAFVFGEPVPTFQEMGAYRKRCDNDARRALALLFSYSRYDITTHPTRYIIAAEARRRDGRDPYIPKPEHLKKYRIDEIHVFADQGFDRANFHQSGHDPKGNRLFIYLDPATDV